MCIPSDDLRHMIGELAANLMRGLGDRNSDTVFLRAFSVLMLAEIVHYDNAHHVLDDVEVRQMLELGIVYLDAELDQRGWVHGEGWAHSVAHTADLLFVLAQSRSLGRDGTEPNPRRRRAEARRRRLVLRLRRR